MLAVLQVLMHELHYENAALFFSSKESLFGVCLQFFFFFLEKVSEQAENKTKIAVVGIGYSNLTS